MPNTIFFSFKSCHQKKNRIELNLDVAQFEIIKSLDKKKKTKAFLD
jgi:hypothetical protein